MSCPCQSDQEFSQCCGPVLDNPKMAETAEQMMRARYTAYTKEDVDFVQKSHDPKTRHELDIDETKRWAAETTWQGLEILECNAGGAQDDSGTVEFRAKYSAQGESHSHHELSEFNRRNGQWYFTKGKNPKAQTFVREEPKIGRNDPCVCGSGKKYKKCCGANA